MAKKKITQSALPPELRAATTALLRNLTTTEEKVLRIRKAGGVLTPAQAKRLHKLTEAREEAQREFDALMRRRVSKLRHPSRSNKLKNWLEEK